MATYLAIPGHYVYAHQRLDTGEVFYVGKGSGKRGFSRSGRSAYWKNVVAKCGGFNTQIIASGVTEQEAYNFERILISSIFSQTDIRLTNLNGGGKGGMFNPPTIVREKQRKAKLGRKLSEEHKQKISLANRKRIYVKGYKQTLTDAQKMIKSINTKNQIWTEERKAKISLAKIGFKHSEETKRKISVSKVGKGRPQSEETKQKIRDSWAARKTKSLEGRL